MANVLIMNKRSQVLGLPSRAVSSDLAAMCFLREHLHLERGGKSPARAALLDSSFFGDCWVVPAAGPLESRQVSCREEGCSADPNTSIRGSEFCLSHQPGV